MFRYYLNINNLVWNQPCCRWRLPLPQRGSLTNPRGGQPAPKTICDLYGPDSQSDVWSAVLHGFCVRRCPLALPHWLSRIQFVQKFHYH